MRQVPSRKKEELPESQRLQRTSRTLQYQDKNASPSASDKRSHSQPDVISTEKHKLKKPPVRMYTYRDQPTTSSIMTLQSRTAGATKVYRPFNDWYNNLLRTSTSKSYSPNQNLKVLQLLHTWVCRCSINEGFLWTNVKLIYGDENRGIYIFPAALIKMMQEELGVIVVLGSSPNTLSSAFISNEQAMSTKLDHFNTHIYYICKVILDLRVNVSALQRPLTGAIDNTEDQIELPLDCCTLLNGSEWVCIKSVGTLSTHMKC